jgi:Cu/Ag efflux pump CusA
MTVMLASIAATVALFVVIPKGFFPQQDTGMIMGITEAAQDVSPGRMASLQRNVIDLISKDPAVANATGYIGPGGPTVTENNGRLFILLKPPAQRDLTADQVIRHLNQKLQHVQGMQVFMQATQDINLASRLSKTQYQYTLTDVNQDELNQWASRVLSALQGLPQLIDVASDQATLGRQLKLELILMSLLYYTFLDKTSLSLTVKHAASAVLFVGILAQSGGFFIHMIVGKQNRASIGTTVTGSGAALLVAAIVVLIYGLITAP